MDNISETYALWDLTRELLIMGVEVSLGKKTTSDHERYSLDFNRYDSLAFHCYSSSLLCSGPHASSSVLRYSPGTLKGFQSDPLANSELMLKPS
jgi:hypothetical protein